MACPALTKAEAIVTTYVKGERKMFDKLTPSDIKKMEEEIEHRKLVVRKEALEDVKTARAQGDLSENFEYKAAKQFKNRNESRIRYLEKMIRTAQIVPESSEEGEAGIYKTVTLYFEDDDETEDYTIVTTVQADSLKNRVSIESPMGKALMGRHVGDRVYVETRPGSGYYVVIKEIRKADQEILDAPLREY